MRILICGSRDWTNEEAIEREILYRHPNITILIHGAARGADVIAGRMARKHGIPVMRVPANWYRDGNSAGPIRNHRMLTKHKPDVVLAFSTDIKNSRGTKDMVERARHAKVQTRVFSK